MNKMRYGLFLEYAQSRLMKIGFEFNPFYVIQEGINAGDLKITVQDVDRYICEFLDKEDLPDLARMRNNEIPKTVLEKRFDRGDKCLAIKCENEIIAFNWISFREISSGVYREPLGEREAYLFDMYTDKRFRGKNIAPYLRLKTYQILQQMGKTLFYSVSLAFNSASIRFKKKLNSKILKTGVFLHLFKKYRWSWLVKRYA